MGDLIEVLSISGCSAWLLWLSGVDVFCVECFSLKGHFVFSGFSLGLLLALVVALFSSFYWLFLCFVIDNSSVRFSWIASAGGGLTLFNCLLGAFLFGRGCWLLVQ